MIEINWLEKLNPVLLCSGKDFMCRHHEHNNIKNAGPRIDF